MEEAGEGIKKELFILYLSYKDPRVSWVLRLFTLCVVAYAFSPIDLIPDFIPVLGYMDDLVLIPFGLCLALKWLPKEVVEDNRMKASELEKEREAKKLDCRHTDYFTLHCHCCLAVSTNPKSPVKREFIYRDIVNVVH
ncbi:uncharacterized protein DUF1232 [Anoxybacillus vitaminiphilus]|uniref:Uncharacterized protein DUF1232 n=1 Tax=Paranoxybacillus vitaminiphilus TaxID=581036 RepID=A0A327YHL0_9BACL|nr:uncharacterized protein DUF1232 [Anoxybacillus vitaminiphilus]